MPSINQCTECFTRNDYNHKHELVFARQAEVSNEIDQLRRLLTSIQDGTLTIAELRGTFTFCDGCHRRPGNGIYYSCELSGCEICTFARMMYSGIQCKDFDLCRSCLTDVCEHTFFFESLYLIS